MKRKNTFFDNLMLLLNILLGLVTVLVYVSHYILTKQFPVLGILSLLLPLFWLFNIIFLCYWLLRMKGYVLLSFVLLLIGLSRINQIYNFQKPKKDFLTENTFSVMSYNVRLFNKFNWIKDDSITLKIKKLVAKENPDILCFQEFDLKEITLFEDYQYRFTGHAKNNNMHGQAIFSKFPICKTGVLKFPDTTNNSIYIDLLVNGDTIRVYNIHLQSLKMNTTEVIKDEGFLEGFINKTANTFKTQIEQFTILENNFKNCKHKKIIVGDLNNTAFSYIYRKISYHMNDSFEKMGSGFGKTYNLLGFIPIRIDFILTDSDIKILYHINYSDHLSDHFPVKAVLSL